MMPDKVYLEEGCSVPVVGFVSPAWNSPKDKENTVEYIRKDALLEWIKSEMNRLWELLPDADNANPTEMEIRYLGQYMQMETLENKLNSI